jgi:CheY-like chemotaxis protein
LSRVGSGAPHILVVDDDDSMVSVMTACLRDYRVSACVDPDDALVILQNEPVDLLVADFVMPQMPGDELVHRARSLRPTLRAVIVTGYVAAVHRIADVGILEKPFTRQELLSAVTGQMAAAS